MTIKKMIYALIGSLFFCSAGFADVFGKTEIVGLGLDGGGIADRTYVVVWAKGFELGPPEHSAACAKTRAYYQPAEMTHAFWFPREGFEEEYSMLLAAYTAKKSVFLFATEEADGRGLGIPCKLSTQIYIADI